MSIAIHASWKNVLEKEFEQAYFQQLTERVRQAYIDQKGSVFPKGSQIFRAFDLCPFDQLKVVILGQDPYHGEGQAHGLHAGLTHVPQAFGKQSYGKGDARHHDERDHGELPVQPHQVTQQGDQREPVTRQCDHCGHQLRRAILDLVNKGVRQGAG